jgi:hypothetical protein
MALVRFLFSTRDEEIPAFFYQINRQTIPNVNAILFVELSVFLFLFRALFSKFSFSLLSTSSRFSGVSSRSATSIMTSNCPSTCDYVDPCTSVFPARNIGSSEKRRVRAPPCYRLSASFRPLQQMYKTVYSPSSGNGSSPFTSACICRPAERYKTANMTYGSFHYNNWKFMQKNRPMKNCGQSFQAKMNSSDICNTEVQK